MPKIITSDIIPTDELEKQVKRLEEVFPNQAIRGIAMMGEYEIGCPLFLGINPSFLQNKQKGKYPPIPGDIDYQPYYPPIEVKTVDERKSNRHFLRAIELSNELGFKYTYHYDLLSIRETNESEIQRLISSKSRVCRSYLDEQIQNATKIIGKINPCIIIVENGIVRNLFFDYHIFDFYPASKDNIHGWNEELGVDFIRIEDAYVPILFTGMLATLNSGSYYSGAVKIFRGMREVS